MQGADGLEALCAVEEAVAEFVKRYGCPPRNVCVGLMQKQALEALAGTDGSGRLMMLPPPHDMLTVSGVPVAISGLRPEVVALGW